MLNINSRAYSFKNILRVYQNYFFTLQMKCCHKKETFQKDLVFWSALVKSNMTKYAVFDYIEFIFVTPGLKSNHFASIILKL